MAEHLTNSGWAHIKVIAELMTSTFKLSGHVAKTLDTKAYLILRHQPWRQFALMLSISNKCCELCVHTYDYSGSTISPHFHIESQNDLFLYIFLAIVFGKDDCIGFNPTMIIWELKVHPLPSHHSCIPIKLCSQKKKLRSPTPDSESGKSDSESDETLINHDVNAMHSSPLSLLSSLSLLSLLSYLSSEEARPDVRTAPAQLPTKETLPITMGTTATLLSKSCDPPSQESLRKIQVNDNKYDILKVIFSSTGLIGRGTICYQARRALDGL
ncbi:hypothetical protein DFH29DRAFT_1006565 [Suillus ampliporus]|nr:hypothetical protein DFH29DRAFT_1006565 [Suillus ampliporus]